MHWDPCIVTLGSMYLHTTISIYIGIHAIFLGIHDTIGIRVIALGSMTVHWTMTGTPHHHHVPHGPFLEGA
jgi:hypothetical protein